MDLHHRILGQGHPAIILHGLFGTSDNWQTVGRLLSEEYQVFLVDQRNHGRSPHIPEHTYEAMSNDLAHFMEFNWVHHTHLIGHSMGGKTAMHFALHHPDKVDKLVVIDIAPKTYAGGHEPIFEALLSVDLPKATERDEVEAQLRKHIPNNAIIQFLLKNLTRTKDGIYHWKMNLPVLYDHYSDILGEVNWDTPFEGPTLFVRGSESSYILDDDWSHIHDLFPNAQLATIPGAGHWVHADAGEELLELLLHFLAD